MNVRHITATLAASAVALGVGFLVGTHATESGAAMPASDRIVCQGGPSSTGPGFCLVVPSNEARNR